jgi:hypothetical protein
MQCSFRIFWTLGFCTAHRNVPSLQPAVKSLVTQDTQAQVIQKHQDEVTVDTLEVRTRGTLAWHFSLKRSVGTMWMDMLSTKEAFELDDSMMKYTPSFQPVIYCAFSFSFYTCMCDHHWQ